MRNLSILFFALLFVQLTTFAQWTQVRDIPTARRFISSCNIDGNIYVIGGTNSPISSGPAVDIMEVYDPTLDIWDITKAPMHTSRVELGACAVNGKIYVIGGAPFHGGSPIQTVEEYDPLTDTWDNTKEPMPTARYGCAYGVIDSKIYVAGGTHDNNFTVSKKLEIYDPLTDSWDSTNAEMPIAIYQPQGEVIDDKFYVIGGLIGAPWIGQKTVQKYDPVTDNWSIVASLNKGRVGHTVNAVAGKLYVVGGDTQPPPLKVVEEYDPNSNTWKEIIDAPFYKNCHSASIFANKIYLFSGSTTTIFPVANHTHAVYSFDPNLISVETQNSGTPTEFELNQNYPNPFNPTTKIEYSIPQSTNVVIRIFDILGNEIKTIVNEEKPSGTHEIEFDGNGLTSGIFFYQLQTGDFFETKKMVLVK